MENFVLFIIKIMLFSNLKQILEIEQFMKYVKQKEVNMSQYHKSINPLGRLNC